MKKLIYIFSLVALIGATSSYAVDPHNPIFPRDTNVKLRIAERLGNELTTNVFPFVTMPEFEKLRELFDRLDHSNRDSMDATLNQCKIQREIGMIIAEAHRKAIDSGKVIPPIEPHNRFVRLEVDHFVKRGVDFGNRYNVFVGYTMLGGTPVEAPVTPEEPRNYNLAIAIGIGILVGLGLGAWGITRTIRRKK